MEQTFYQKTRWQFILFLARRLPDCKTITPLFGEALDRKMSLRERVIIRLHIFTCEACERYVAQIKFLREAMRSHDQIIAKTVEDPSLSLRSDSKERIKRAVSSARRP